MSIISRSIRCFRPQISSTSLVTSYPIYSNQFYGITSLSTTHIQKPQQQQKNKKKFDQKNTFSSSSKRIGLLALFSTVAYSGVSETLSAGSSGSETETKNQKTEPNPLENSDGLPQFDLITPQHIVPAMTKLLDKLETDFKILETKIKNKEVPINYENVIQALEKIQYPSDNAWGIINHLQTVKNSDALREAYKNIQPRVVKINTEISQNRIIYDALKNMKEDTKIWNQLERAQQRLIQQSLRGMELNGVALNEADQKKFSKLKLDLAQLVTKFNENVLDSTKAFKVILTDKKDVEGIPASALGLAAQTAKKNGHNEATAENGPWQFSLDFPSYLPVMQHSKNRKLREQLYREQYTLASKDKLDNKPLINEMLKLKKEMANLLGYKTYAEKSLAPKMAPNVEAVDSLCELLRDKSYSSAQKELKTLRAYAKSKGFNEELQLWDIPYWAERQKEELYGFEAETLKPYFPLPYVTKGLFDLAKKLFNVEITKIGGKEAGIEVWHPDVQYYSVKDLRTGQHIANFYLDAYSRPGEKRGGAWLGTCIGRNDYLNKKPVAYVVCNGSEPVGDKPSLMSFNEVQTLFHEFGHGLQLMLSNVKWGGVSELLISKNVPFLFRGLSGVEWDAVEIPSQFMENWVYHKPTLYSFAKHYQTGEPLPEEIFKKLAGLRQYNAGMAMIRQLFFAQLDMELHHRYDPNTSQLTPFDIQKKIAKRYTVIPPLENDTFLCTFLHIFGGGYDAGYYSYKWAEVMSADAFGVFEEGGLDNEKKLKEIGQRFRETILGIAGGDDPAVVYRKFSGRDPKVDALLRHAGLDGSTQA